MRTNDEIINLLEKLRDEQNISLSELARRVGLAKSALSRYFNKTRQFPVNKVNDFAKALNTTPQYILGFEETEQTTNKVIPVVQTLIHSITVYGKVCAGDGIEALENPIDQIGDPYYRIKKEKFALQVCGDSMNNVVSDGMYAVIEKTPVVNNGEIAVVMIDDDIAMLKRFYQVDDMVILRPDSINPDHKPITFIGEEINSLKILGRYLGYVTPMEKLL